MLIPTRHAKERMEQRGFSIEDLEFAKKFGQVIRNGSYKLWCLGKLVNSKEGVPWRLRGLMVVTPAKNPNLVITVYRCNWKQRFGA